MKTMTTVLTKISINEKSDDDLIITVKTMTTTTTTTIEKTI